MSAPSVPAGIRPAAVSLVADAAAVVLFAALGRASHHGALTVPGLAETAWPFLAALVVGWTVLRAGRAPVAPLRVGLPLAGVVVAGGLALRWATGGGIAPAFVVVTALVVGVLLVGWRAAAVGVVALSRRARAARRSGGGRSRSRRGW